MTLLIFNFAKSKKTSIFVSENDEKIHKKYSFPHDVYDAYIGFLYFEYN